MRAKGPEKKEDRAREMFNRFIEAMRETTAPSGFENYLRSLGASRKFGGPTIDEARRDYRSAMKRR
jgi:hypothetical protein